MEFPGDNPDWTKLIRKLDYSRPKGTYYEEVKRILTLFTPDDYYEGHYALEEAYDLQESVYLYYDDDHVIKPYAVIALHPMEERISGTLFDRWLRRYAKLNVMEATSIRFTELLEMDMLSVINVFQVAISYGRQKGKVTKDAEEELRMLADGNQTKR